MHMDYSGDCIMDYRLWSMLPGGTRFQEHAIIPLIAAASNITPCSPWLVITFSDQLCIAKLNVPLTAE
jgi:hypothetical protein